MNYAAYERYVPSKSMWLDQLPDHWKQLRVKHVIERMESGVSVNSDASPAVAEEIGVLKTSCVYGDQFSPDENKRVLDDELGRVACHVKANRLIISRMNTPELVGSCGYVDRDFPNLFLPDRLWQTIFGKSRECLPRFAWYYLTSRPAKSAISSLAAGTSGSMQNIGQDAFVGIGFPLPPLDEQQSIARFLDAKTAQIDALVAQKRQLIDKLKEKRQALIGRTVTRGLPPEAAKAAGLEPNTKMKDSGVEWLGVVPADWVITAVWHQFFLGRGRVISHEDISENPGPYPVYSSQTENDGVLGYLGSFDFDGEFITWTTDGANAGTVFSRSGKFNCTNVCGTLTAKHPGRIDNRYVSYALSIATAEFVRHDINPKLMNNVMKSIRFALPSKIEQTAIADYLDTEIRKFESLGMEIEVAVDRLTEYRQALITSAVTGKIDVRGLA